MQRQKNEMNKIQKHFQNVMLVGMASENSKNYTYKCVDRSRHNGIKGAMTKYRIAGKFGEHYIWRISRWKLFGDFNFGDELPASLASRLSSCTYLKYRYRYACAATKG